MRFTYTAVIERCPDSGLFVGYVPGFPGAHSQGDTLEEVNQNLREVIAMLLEGDDPPPSSSAPMPAPLKPTPASTFVGTQVVEGQT